MATLDEQQELNRLLEQEAELRTKIDRLKGESITKAEELARKAKERAQNASEILDLLQLESKARADQIDANIVHIDREKERGQISAALAEQRKKALREIKALTSGEAKSLEAVYQKNVQNLAIELKRKGLILDGVSAMDQMAENLSRAVGFGGSLTKNIIEATQAGGSFSDIFEKAGETLKNNFSKGGVLAFAINNTAQLLKAFDEIVAGLAASTGQGRDFAGVVEESFSNTSDFATSLEDTANAVDGLFSSFVGFNNLSEASKTSLTESATLMGRLGVDIQETGERLNYLTVALGMSVPEADKFNQSLIRLAQGLGMAPGALTAQFNQLIPKLSLFKDGGKKAFEETAIAARQLGLDLKTGVQDLFALTEGLQDFESAADKVASINVVLGGSFVNAFDLVMGAAEGPVAQVKQLQDAFQQAGKSFDDMGFYERKFLADSMGVSFDNLTKIMNGQINTEEDLKTTEEQMRDAMQATASTMETLNAAIQSMSASLTPLLLALKPFVELFATFVKAGGDIVLTFAAIGVGAEMLAVKLKATEVAAKKIGIAFGGFFAGFLLFNKLKSEFNLKRETAMILGLAVAVAALAVAMTAGAAAVPIASGLAALGIGFAAAGAMDSGSPKPKTQKDIGASIGSFTDFQATPGMATGGKVSGAGVALVGETGPELVSLPRGAQVTNRNDTADFVKRSAGQGGADLKPAVEQMMKTMNQFIAAANQVMTRSQPPVEVALNLDGRKLTKKIVSNINKDFSLTNEARLPSEGLG